MRFMSMTMILTDDGLYGWYKKVNIQKSKAYLPMTTDQKPPDTIIRHRRNISNIISELSPEDASKLQEGTPIHVSLTRSHILKALTPVKL